MSMRSNAIKYLESKIKNIAGPIYTSKYYEPAESWTNSAVWWLEIPEAVLTDTNIPVNLLCQMTPDGNDFYILQVSAIFLKNHVDSFQLNKGKVSLFLSAEPATIFIDQRGPGNISFKDFVIS
jgi:hypothetical protein